MSSSASSAPCAQTYTYKTFKNTDGSQTSIPVDVYLPSAPGSAPIVPVIWVHTGGFLQGTRKFVPPHFLRAVEKYNLALVAPDFRLCPQVSILEVLQDVADCINWTLNPKARSKSGFHSDGLSSSQYILGGSSAGGWPALLLGLGLHPLADSLLSKPKAVFAVYAITTVTKELASFFFETQRPLSWAVDGKLIEKEPIEKEGHFRKCLNSKHQLLDAENTQEVLVRTEAPPASNPVRAALYNFARQEACYPDLILLDASESKNVCTPSLIKSKVSSSSRTPTLICYGDSDPKVLHSQSLYVIEALESVGYRRDAEGKGDLLVIEEKGADHLFDMESNKEIDGMWEWLKAQLE